MQMKHIFDRIPNDKIVHLESHLSVTLFHRSNCCPAVGRKFCVMPEGNNENTQNSHRFRVYWWIPWKLWEIYGETPCHVDINIHYPPLQRILICHFDSYASRGYQIAINLYLERTYTSDTKISENIYIYWRNIHKNSIQICYVNGSISYHWINLNKSDKSDTMALCKKYSAPSIRGRNMLSAKLSSYPVHGTLMLINMF